MSLPTGQAIAPGVVLDDRYRVVRTVAEGGMSLVYEVEDLRLPGRFALKLMREWIGDSALREAVTAQFEREAALLSTMSHPNLPRVTDHFLVEGRRCLVEELVDGKTLEELAADAGGQPLDPGRVTDWAVQICDALEYLHSKGIIYRDLKPSNCMCTESGTIKLIDFGIVRFFTTGKARDTVVMGTPGFAAPEQYGREQTDPRADIFSLGVLMHHLLTGHDPTCTPFVFPAPRSLRPDLPERTEQIIVKALSLRPEERFQDAADLRRALKGEVMLLEDVEGFSYRDEAPPVRDLVRRSAVLVGAGAATMGLLASSPVFLSLAACYTPMWLALLCAEFVLRRRRAETRIEVTRSGLRYRCGPKAVEASWASVERLVFASHPLLGVRAARVQTEAGSFAFVVEGNQGQSGCLFEVPALEESARLCQLIIKGACLVSASPGGACYNRSA